MLSRTGPNPWRGESGQDPWHRPPWADLHELLPLNESEQRALAIVAKRATASSRPTSPAQLAKRMKISSQRAHHLLAELISKGWVRPHRNGEVFFPTLKADLLGRIGEIQEMIQAVWMGFDDLAIQIGRSICEKLPKRYEDDALMALPGGPLKRVTPSHVPRSR